MSKLAHSNQETMDLIESHRRREEGTVNENYEQHQLKVAQEGEEVRVRIPTSAEEAEMMVRLGTTYLQEQAPERLVSMGLKKIK